MQSTAVCEADKAADQIPLVKDLSVEYQGDTCAMAWLTWRSRVQQVPTGRVGRQGGQWGRYLVPQCSC